MQIPPIPQAQDLLDIALAAAGKKAEKIRGTLPGKTRLDKSKLIEVEKLTTIKSRLDDQFLLISKNFPSLDTMPEYQKELLYVSMDYAALKKALGAVPWARKRIALMTKDHTNKIKRSTNPQDVNAHRRAYYGRVSSVVNQIKKELVLLQTGRSVLNDFPTLDLSLPIVCIAGFPNVGKSTLLKKITGSNVEIAAYAFTTKRLNVGSCSRRMRTIQFVDTPGKLNREKMNLVELQAHIALKFLATHVVYVIDPTESYSLLKQKQLFTVMRRYRKPISCYMSKTDIAEPEQIEAAAKLEPHYYSDSKELVDFLFKEIYTLKK